MQALRQQSVEGLILRERQLIRSIIEFNTFFCGRTSRLFLDSSGPEYSFRLCLFLLSLLSLLSLLMFGSILSIPRVFLLLRWNQPTHILGNLIPLKVRTHQLHLACFLETVASAPFLINYQIISILQCIFSPAIEEPDHIRPFLPTILAPDLRQQAYILFRRPRPLLQIGIKVAVPVLPALLGASVHFIWATVHVVELL